MDVASGGLDNLRAKEAATTSHDRFSNLIEQEQASRPVSECSVGRLELEVLSVPVLDLEGAAELTTHPHPHPHLHSQPHLQVALDPRLPATRLRKKPKSLSIASTSFQPAQSHIQANAHMRRLSGIPKTLSFPSFHSQQQPSESTIEPPRPSSSHSANVPSTPLLRAQSSSSIIRSPSQKRKPPASHSSYGVETTLGPPPSYSTQRTLSEDRVWNLNRGPPTRTGSTTVPDRVTDQPNEDIHPQTQQQQHSQKHLTSLPLPRSSDPDISSPETIDTQNTPQDSSDMTPPTSAGGTNIPDDVDMPAKGLGLDGNHDDAKASSSDETHKSEDLFLNIAKTDASRTLHPTSKTEKRRSRISLPFFSNPRPSTGTKPSPMATQFESASLAPQSEEPRRFGKRSSLGQHVPGALTSAQYFDDSRSRVSRPADERSQIGSVTDRSEIRSRRYSNANVDTLRPPTRSYTTRTNRLVSENLLGDRFKGAGQPATESTTSTTAPSVWDELDDMKSRIRKLELTGKLPPSSAAAMGITERPRTATTQATTMSSSPKHKTTLPTMPSQIEGISSTIHPLLHEALNNAKAALPNEVYQKLQATAQDALQLSTMMNLEGYNGSNAIMSPTNERQIRRRTESMCRSLTELAIAMLADQRTLNSPAQRPSSRDTYAQPSSGLRSRRLSNEPSDRPPVVSRVQSRLDSRRTSLHMTQSHSPATAQPPTSFETPPVAASISSSARIPRSATVVRSRRTPNYMDGANDEDDASLAIRPVSRAQTDVNTAPSSYRSIPRDRVMFSREYTKQHPLPSSKSHIASQQVDLPIASSTRTPLPQTVNLVSRRNISTTQQHMTPQSAPIHHHPQTIFHRQPSDDSSSPILTPSHSHVQRPPFTISIERGHNSLMMATNADSPTALPTTPDSLLLSAPNASGASGSGTAGRASSNTRRSLGFASRISNVSSRLKAARAERQSQNQSQGQGQGQGQSQANMSVLRTPLGKEGDNNTAVGGNAGMMVDVDAENMLPVNVSERIGSIGAARGSAFVVGGQGQGQGSSS